MKHEQRLRDLFHDLIEGIHDASDEEELEQAIYDLRRRAVNLLYQRFPAQETVDVCEDLMWVCCRYTQTWPDEIARYIAVQTGREHIEAYVRSKFPKWRVFECPVTHLPIPTCAYESEGQWQNARMIELLLYSLN